MAKISLIGPAGREAVSLEIGAGNNPPRNGNVPGNNVPPNAPAGADDGMIAGGNQNDDTQPGRGVTGGNETQRPADNGQAQERVAVPDEAKGRTVDAETPNKDLPAPKQPGQGEIPNKDLPVGKQTNPAETPDIDLPFPKQPVFGKRGPEGNEENPRDRDRDLPWRDNRDANRAILRRDQIRDYLRQNLRDAVMEARSGTADRIDLQRVAQTVADRLARTHNYPEINTGRAIGLIREEISRMLAGDAGLGGRHSGAIPYDRALQIASLLLAGAVNEAPARFAQVTEQAMLHALIFLQLCCEPGRHMRDMREITGHKPSVLPDDIPWAAFRSLGLLAAGLLKEGGTQRSTAHLEAAVQRFLKMLAASGQLGILLAATRLAADAQAGRVPAGGVATLVRIYELIAQLMIATERAMKEAAEAAARKPAELRSTDKALAFGSALEPAEAESTLRQYLAFNPSAQTDSRASAFFSEQVADSSTRIAVDSSHREISEWISSGRHRFVAEADIGKPVGIVLDKASDECFTASRVRVVLVRDGSVLGWHVLRSSLVG